MLNVKEKQINYLSGFDIQKTLSCSIFSGHHILKKQMIRAPKALSIVFANLIQRGSCDSL